MATRIAKKTAELMMVKLKAKLDALYSDQESNPAKQGNNTQQFRNGGMLPRFWKGGEGPIDPRLQYNIQNAYDNAGIYDRYHNPLNPVGSIDPGDSAYPYANGQGKPMNSQRGYNNTQIDPRQGYGVEDHDTFQWASKPGDLTKALGQKKATNPNQPVSPATIAVQPPNQQGIDNGPTEPNNFNPGDLMGDALSMMPGTPNQDSINRLLGTNGNPGMGGLPPQQGGLPGSRGGQNPNINDAGTGLRNQGQDRDWAGIAGAIGSFAPGLYNIANAFKKPEVERPQDYYNPQYNNAMSLMRNRRYDVRPQLEQNLLNQNTYNRNLRNTASSRGELMSNMGGGYGNKLRSDSAVFAQKNTMDNQYRAEEAQLRSALGQERAQTNMQVGDWNARNRAAQRNYGAAAAENIGTASSMLLRNRNQRRADSLRGEALGAMSTHLNEWMPGLQDLFKDNKEWEFKKRVKIGG